MKPRLAVLATVTSVPLLALTAAAVADRETVHYTAAGQAAARAAVLRRADLGSAAGWSGGAKKPTISSTLPCRYQPKQSDLVLIGAAETTWQNMPVFLDSASQVLKTPAMVRLDWQRTVVAPQMLPCLRRSLAKQFGGSAQLVSFARVRFPAIAPYFRKFRALIDEGSATTKVRVLADVVLVGRGRTEITLTTVAPYSSNRVVSAAELRLAKLLLARVRS
jgi:hypothetical protein